MTELEKLIFYIGEKSKTDYKATNALEIVNNYIDEQIDIQDKVQADCID